MHDRLRHRLLGAWSVLIARKPWHILFIALLLTLGAIGVTLLGLRFEGNRNNLISKNLDWNQRFVDWQEHFPGAFDLFVIVDANPAGGAPSEGQIAAAQAVVSELGRRLSESPRIEHVVWGFDAGQFSAKTVRMLPLEQMRQRLEEARQAKVLLESPTVQTLVGQAAAAMRQSGDAQAQRPPAEVAGDIADLTRLVKAVDAVLHAEVTQPVDFAKFAGGSDEGWQYLSTGSHRLFFLRLTPRSEPGKISGLAGAIDDVRAIIDVVSANHPGPQIGLTGIEVVEADETDAAMVDSTQASIIAVVLITIVLVAAFHSWRTPLMAMVALLTGVAWSFGLLTVTIGHLQVISVVFTVMLLGLGIAYGIHLASGYELLRPNFASHRGGYSKAMRLTMQQMGPGIVTGAVTTAAAFGTTLFTDFTGVAEMGFIAGAGIMLCLAAMFSVFPAMLRLVKPRRHQVAPMHERSIHFFQDSWVMPFARHPWSTMVVAAVLTGLSLWAILHMRFDYDLMKLQPRGVDSVMWQQRIAEDSGSSIWFGISVTDNLDEARQRAEQFMRQPTVGSVGGVGLLFPDQEATKLELLADLKRDLAPAMQAAAATSAPSNPPDLLAQLDLLGRLVTVATAGQDVPPAIREALGQFTTAVQDLIAYARTLDDATRQARLERLQREYAAFRAQTAQSLTNMLDPSPLQVDDLPDELLRSYRDDRGRYALEIYPKLPASADPEFSPLHPRFLPHFVQDLEKVDPSITGVVVQIYRSGDLIKRSYQMAGMLALVVVFVLVWIDFRSLTMAALSLIPVAVGFACTFGIMHLMGVSINPANIIVLPLMFGIGVDAGVHMLHRYRMDPDLEPRGLAKGTGKGITLTNLTTIIGFGAMTLARHRGIASLGMVLTVGIALTTLACWTVMPAILQLHARLRRKSA